MGSLRSTRILATIALIDASNRGVTGESLMPSMPADKGEPTIHEVRRAEDVVSPLGLPLPSFIPRRYKPRNLGSWSGHLAFANDLITATQPELIVELGTHWGEAYFTFCQAVQESSLSSLCYAVDHWLGDEHTGPYGEEVFEEVRQYNERHYCQFSYLLRAGFDDVASQFAVNSIGLLHIDGLHTYEAVSHDFRTWLPKVKPGGIILLHDICPKHEDFGVWRLWDEIKAEFPNTFEFHHSWGLGVVQKENEANRSFLTECLFHSSPIVREELRRRYVIYASHLDNMLRGLPDVTPKETGAKGSDETTVQVFPYGRTGHSEATSLLRKIKTGTWNTLVFELPEGGEQGPLRVDPGEEPSFVEIDEILISSCLSGDLLWSASPSAVSHTLVAAGTATIVPSENGSCLISFGDDPQLILLVTQNFEGPLKLTISLRVNPSTMPVPEIVNDLVKAVYATTEQRMATARVEGEMIAHELAQAVSEKNRALLEQDQAITEKNKAILDKDQAIAEANQAIAEANQAIAEKNQALVARSEAIQANKATQELLFEMHESLSWRATEPIRRLMTVMRSGPRKRKN
jgi:hypothetical protein